MRRITKIRQERERIARAIGLIVLGVAPFAAFSQACSSSDSSAADADGGGDAQIDTSTADSEISQDAIADGDAGSCAITATPFDAGRLLDAEGGGIDLSCTYDLPCGLPPAMFAIGCATYYGDPDGSPDAAAAVGCTIPEGLGCTDGSFTPGPRGELHMTCLDCFGGGRRPRGLRKSRTIASTAIGAYFARMAHDEAASVLAFDRMVAELEKFDAPADLKRAAHKAKRDEISHAHAMTTCTHAHGATMTQPRMKKPRARSLEAMAIENAVEGCVNETFGAILLAWQSRFAKAESLRRTFAVIARDEAEHAALAWSVARWADTRLDPAAQKRVRRAHDRAVRALTKSTSQDLGCDRALGLPDAAQRRALVDAFVNRFATSAIDDAA